MDILFRFNPGAIRFELFDDVIIGIKDLFTFIIFYSDVGMLQVVDKVGQSIDSRGRFCDRQRKICQISP